MCGYMLEAKIIPPPNVKEFDIDEFQCNVNILIKVSTFGNCKVLAVEVFGKSMSDAGIICSIPSENEGIAKLHISDLSLVDMVVLHMEDEDNIHQVEDITSIIKSIKKG